MSGLIKTKSGLQYQQVHVNSIDTIIKFIQFII